ncbi:MAG: glycosyl hydrolase [Clostridiales bacterium]|nr:glycosyl hydrolase [Clostridiales bacterium]
MLYPHNSEKSLSENLFRSPSAEYRGTPFWAWNCELDEKELLWQIDQMKEMGLGGFHMHCRSGMSTPYLTDEFMKLVGACVEKARENQMLAWLYDEDRWPSGAAGGLVTKDHSYRARTLLFTVNKKENETPLAVYAISLDENKCLKDYRLLNENEGAKPGEMVRYAYLCVAEDNSWYNNQAYLDTLSPDAVKKFIEITHERYAECFEKDFGGVIPAIFTDEPQFSPKLTLTFPESDVDAVIPWTDDLEDSYQKTYGESLLAKLPEIFWELPNDLPSPTRYHFHDHLTERFTQAFADQIGAWCEKHNIMLTGHMMEEPTLRSQTRMLGEAMRSYRGFQLPGIDMLCDRREFTTAKQAQSAAHQYGRPGVMSELYGVTNWDYEFRGHKSQGDWQAALGVTVRVPHLAWVSMEGAAKRDYPACINYQSPWYKEYPYVENHFARLNTALTRGKPQVKVGLIHPIESYWLRFGPAAQTDDRRAEMDDRFQKVTAWLLHGLIDFDFICEALLPEQCKVGSAPLQVGEMAYDVIVVPACETIRATTLDRLEKFAAAGGKLIFMGDAPKFVDAIPSERAKLLADKATCIPYTNFDLLESLEELREIDVRTQQGNRAPKLLHQIRQDGEGKWLFLCNGHLPDRRDQPDEWYYTLSIKGQWAPTIYDTMTGEIRPAACSYTEGKTILDLVWHGHDSLLLYLTPGKAENAESVQKLQGLKEVARFRGSYPISLSEPNVLLLDQAEYAYNDGPWQPKAEILTLEGKIRHENGLSPRHSDLPQPWVVPADTQFKNYLSLRFTIESEIACEKIQLALEKPETTEITWNGEKIASAPEGYFVDKSIKTVALPALKEGTNTLILRLPLGNRCGAEWCYLLGDFGVKVLGDEATIIPPVRELAFGDWSHQGLPFYAGNVTYHLSLDTDGDFYFQCAQFRNPLLTVDVDGKRAGIIAYAPYTLPISCKAGKHQIDITAFGNRHNAFGAVHCGDENYDYFGPRAWEVQDGQWADEYRLKPIGIQMSPRILK